MLEFHNLLRERIPEFRLASAAAAIRLRRTAAQPRWIQADLVCV